MECVRTNKIQILNSENRNDNNNNKIKGLILKQNEKGKKIFFTKLGLRRLNIASCSYATQENPPGCNWL